MPMITPPLAVPSSLASTNPVTPSDSWNCRAWAIAFWPVVASTASTISCGEPGCAFSSVRFRRFSSSMRLALVWRRPAVSQSTTWMLSALARATASKSTAPGSDPSFPRTMGTPARSAQTSSCSPAAARKVSPAPRMTDFPACFRRAASFPMVVVFPVPFTPTTMTTSGGGVPGGRSGSPPCPDSPGATPSERMRSTSSRSAALTSVTSDSSRRLSRSRTDSSRRVAVRTPTSAEKRISSNSARVESSSSLAAPTKAFSRAMNPLRVFARPSASVRPASASASLRRASSCAARSAASRASSAVRAAASACVRAATSASRRALSSASVSFLRSYSTFRCASETSRRRRSTSARVAASEDRRASAAASASSAVCSSSRARCSRAARAGGSVTGAGGRGGSGRSAGFGGGSSDGGLGARRPTATRASSAISSAAAMSSATAMTRVWVSAGRAKASKGTGTSKGPRTFSRAPLPVKRRAAASHAHLARPDEEEEEEPAKHHVNDGARGGGDTRAERHGADDNPERKDLDDQVSRQDGRKSRPLGAAREPIDHSEPDERRPVRLGDGPEHRRHRHAGRGVEPIGCKQEHCPEEPREHGCDRQEDPHGLEIPDRQGEAQIAHRSGLGLLRQRPRRLAARRIDGRGLRAGRGRDGHRMPLPLAPRTHCALAARGLASDDLVIDRAGRLRRKLRLESAQPTGRVWLHVRDLLLSVAAAPQHLRLPRHAGLVAGPGDLRAHGERAARTDARGRIHREPESLLDDALLDRLEADGEPGARTAVAAEALLSVLVLGGELVLDVPVRLVRRDLRLVALALDTAQGQPRPRSRFALLAQEDAAERDGGIAANARTQRDFLPLRQRRARLAVIDDGRPGLARDLHRAVV